MAENPLVTVVIPTWNRSELVREAIASVVAQTYDNWELVVTDDSSTDGTLDRLREIRDSRVRLLALDHSGNVSRVRNRGADHGTGSLIAFLDSDDLWLPQKLELQVAALRGGSARWCYADYAHIDGQGARTASRGAFRPRNGWILDSLLGEQTAACICTVLVERALFEELGGFDETLLSREDLDFEFRLASAAEAIAVPDVAVLVREHPGRTTSTLDHPHEASAKVFEKLLAREADQDIRRIALGRWSRLLVDGGAHCLARGEFARGLWLLGRAVRAGAAFAVSAKQPWLDPCAGRST